MRRAALAAAALLALGCGERGARTNPAASAGPIVGAPTNPVASAGPTVGAQTNQAASAAPIVGAQTNPWIDPEEQRLAQAAVTSITPARRPAPRGSFAAVLGGAEGGRTVTLSLMLSADPIAYRRPLAFARLARALGARVVPRAALAHVPAGDLARMAEASPEAAATVREARVLNDGTVDALLLDAAPGLDGAVIVDVDQGKEIATWERWAASAEPAPGEDAALTRDFVEMLALDYLAGNVVRRQALLRGGALALVDNASTFTPHADQGVIDRMLRRLRAVQRFPRGLREGLSALDRGRATAIFAAGSFDRWLLAPRVMVELDERRAALLSLIEAKIMARGADAVLSL